MMTTPLLVQMKTRVAAEKGHWRQLCEEAGVDYVWLFKVIQGRIKDPGVTRVERVIAALDRRSSKMPACEQPKEAAL